jgi:serine/threonine-protein kinase RsbW
MRSADHKEEGWMHWAHWTSDKSAAEGVVELELSTKSTIDRVSKVVDEAVDFIRQSGYFAGDLRDVELALYEAVSNAVLHGNHLNPAKIVSVLCRCSLPEGILLVVRDQGEGFAPHKVRNPLAVENLGLSHGRGIHLMKLLMDDVHFEHRGREVRLRKYAAGRRSKG